jgi:hypothetical protein
MHILKNTQGTIEFVFDQGDATGAVAVSVKNADGTVVASGNATHDTSITGRYTFALAPQADVASLTATATGTFGGVANQSLDVPVEIVGSVLFAIAELRDFSDRKLANATGFPDTLLAAKRDTITDDFEQICNVSFVRRYGRDTLEGEQRRTLYLMHRRPIKLLAVTVNGVALSGPEVAEIVLHDSGKLERPTPWPYNPVSTRNVVVEYEYGYPVPPAQIKEAAKTLARYDLLARDISDRTISINTELGSVRLSVPGQNYPTGIPIVDAALERYDATADFEVF